MRAQLLKSVVGVLALATALFAAPREAAAQFTRIVDMEAIGGFTAYQAKVVVWYYPTNGRGFVLVEKAFHNGTTVYETAQISNAEVIDIWWKAYNARPWSAPETQASLLNVDLPNIRVTYMTHWSQLVRADYGARNLPRESAAMRACKDALWDLADKVSNSELFRYEAAGGLTGYRETTVINQMGKITVDVSYTHGPASYTKEGYLSPEQVNELKALCANWWSLPDKFDWPPGMAVADGISYSGTYTSWGWSKKVSSKTMAQESAAYKAVLAKVAEFRDALP